MATQWLFEQGGNPQYIWYPGYGWMLKGGLPTETTKAFYEKNPEDSRSKGRTAIKRDLRLTFPK